MATRFQLKRNAVGGVAPTTIDLATAELAVNLVDKKLFTSNGSVVFELGSGTVTSIASGNGLSGGPITSTGTISILANNGITANTSGLFVTQGTGMVVNTTGIHVNSTYINTLSANNTTYLNGQLAAYYTNATNITTGTLPWAQAPTGTVNTSSAFTFTAPQTFNSNVTVNAVIANGGLGVLGQVLTSNGSSVFWASGSAIASVVLSNTSPVSPNQGDLWWNTTSASLYVFYLGQWVISIAAGGSNTNIQFNDSAATGGSNNFTFNKTTNTLNVSNVSINATSISTGTANLVMGNTSAIVANGLFGSNGQVLTSNGTGLFWGFAGGGPYVKLTSNTSVAPYKSYLADTSNGSIYITLPSSPGVGERLAIADGGGDKIINPAIILRNGSTIGGSTDNLSIDVPDSIAEFVYTGSTWKVFI